MRRILLGLLLVLLNVSTAHAEPSFKVSIVCFGVTPDCNRANMVANQALRLIRSQVSVDYTIVSLREMDLRELDPRLEAIFAQDIAKRISEEDGSDLSIFVSTNVVSYILGVSPLGILGKVPGAIICHLPANPTLATKVIAHEYSHALGAGHDVKGLMTPSASDPATSSKLSDVSKAEIERHLREVSAHTN